jgi:hypothetical protein
MTEPAEADYAAARSLLVGWPFDDNEHAYYADIGTCTLYYAIACKIATARAEERERCLGHAEARMKLDWTVVDVIAGEERERCIEAIRACPSLEENGYICEKAVAIAKIRSGE